MSINSKAKRDARKKKARIAKSVRPAPLLQPHAHLLDGEGVVMGGAGRRGGDWVLVVAGKEVASTDSAGMILAMLKHVASLQETRGVGVQLNYSSQLRDAATAEAVTAGMTLEAYLDLLEQERAEHSEKKRQAMLEELPDSTGGASVN